MTWRIRPSDDAWTDYQSLAKPLRDVIRDEILIPWTQSGPHHDRLSLVNGVLFRELDIGDRVTMVFLVPHDGEDEVLILRFKTLD